MTDETAFTPPICERLENDAVCQNRMNGPDPLCREASAIIKALVSEPTDEIIEAGCEAMAKVHAAMRDRNLSDEPESMDDFDEGDVCRAVYRAMSRAALTKAGQ